ncbi:MAG: hypothetical protein ABH843_02850 [Candidatus Omnitrophota bacterium]
MISIFLIIAARILGLLKTRRFLIILSLSLLIGLPWLLHIALNISSVSFHNTAKMPVRIYPVLTILFTIGLSIALVKIKKFKVPLMLLISLVPMSIFYPFRFWCAQGMTGLLVFAGIGLERIYSWTNELLLKTETTKKYAGFFLITLLLYLIFFSPCIYADKNGFHAKLSGSLPTSMFEGKEKDEEYALSRGVFDEKLFNILAEDVRDNSKKGEFIWSNNRYLSAMLWSLTTRPSLSNALLEVGKKNYSINITDAALLLIIDKPKDEFNIIYDKAKYYFNTIKIESEKDYKIYIMANKKDKGLPTQSAPKPLLSSCFAFALLGFYIFLMGMLKI